MDYDPNKDRRKKIHPDTQRPSDYKTKTAVEILHKLKGGATLSDCCTNEGPLPSVPRFLEWLEDPTCKVWRRHLKDLYEEALDIRAQVWQDRAISTLANLPREATSAQIRREEVHANMLLKQSQLHMDEQKKRLVQHEQEKGITVVVREFKIPQPTLPEEQPAPVDETNAQITVRH